jgi:hypothetical protein
MTNAHEIDIELTQPEIDALTAKAKSIGYELEAYLRLRLVTGSALPEPSAFFSLFRRLTAFAADYEAYLRSFPGARPPQQYDRLTQSFAGLLEDWDELYGPR